MQAHAFIEDGRTKVYGRKTYSLCGMAGCDRPKNAPVHRGPQPKVQGLQDRDRHPFLVGPVRLRCGTCGKVRNSQRHRSAVAGIPLVPRVRPVPAIAEPPARDRAEPRAGQEPLLHITLGYCDALQVVESVPVAVRFNAKQLARAIRDALGRAEPSREPALTNGHTNGHAEPRGPVVIQQAGTPAVRRSFRSGNVRHLFEIAIAAGWTWRRSGNGHVIIDAPGQKQHISLSTTMSDAGAGRSWGNLKAEAKRKGLAIGD